jgi:hypothetical protein
MKRVIMKQQKVNGDIMNTNKCPECGSDNIICDDMEFFDCDSSIICYYTCKNCDTILESIYDIKHDIQKTII